MTNFSNVLPNCTCSNGSFGTWMATAAVVSAATTFILTRRYFSKLISRQSVPRLIVKEDKKPASAAAVTDDGLSYLCTSCGTEKASYPAEPATAKGPVKMVILVRTDLNMGKGKAAAQCCHAVLAAYKTASARQPTALRSWENSGQPKVTLKVESEQDLDELLKKARLAGIVAESIRDAGRTQVASGTKTVGAIGPAPASLIDMVTGHLKLY